MHFFVEGIQGMGKSTLVRRLEGKYPGSLVYREGDYCPVELAWCTWMSEAEYSRAMQRYPSLESEIRRWTVREGDKYIVSYTRILTEEPGFHKYMEQFEIYNGKRTAEEFQEIVLMRYRNLTSADRVQIQPVRSGHVIYECVFFQNIMEELILYQELSDQEICRFYGRLAELLQTLDFRLYYLYGDGIEDYIRQIKEERADEQGNQLWFGLMMEYFKTSPYGRRHGADSFDDLIRHFRHRQELERRILGQLPGKCVFLLPAKAYSDEDL